MSIASKFGYVSGFVLFAFLVLAIGIAGSLHFDPLCGEEIFRELPSADGAYIATWLERNCGATTNYVEHVNLRTANRKLSADFFGGTITEGEVFTFDQGSRGDSPGFRWTGNKILQIDNSCDGRTSKSYKWRDVEIDYTDPTCKPRNFHDAKPKK